MRGFDGIKMRITSLMNCLTEVQILMYCIWLKLDCFVNRYNLLLCDNHRIRVKAVGIFSELAKENLIMHRRVQKA